MPPGYQNRLTEIQRLIADLDEMGRFGRLLCEVGPRLGEAAKDAFGALKFETQLVEDASFPIVVVRIDPKRRLLVVPSPATEPIQKKSPELGFVFQMLQDVDDQSEHVVLLTNVDPETPPANRPAALTADALALLARMGASHLPGATLFTLWKLSLQGSDRARAQVERLHEHEGGTFELSASALR
jgi:hypothetical protein